MIKMSENGTERCWDHEDCPRGNCDGELQQQDRFNVMCLECEIVFTHQKDTDEHRLIHDCKFVARKPRTVADGGVRVQRICDEFVREHAVPADDAESWVHIGIDDHYHPAGGFWFPTGEMWGDSSGWVSSKYDIPDGEVIQYPCSVKEPEIRGKESLPDYIVNRTMDLDRDDG
jgi:hypothetical protein